MAQQHINSINNIKLLNNSIVIFDRGYPSYDMFNFLDGGWNANTKNLKVALK